jgi:hypothetical protein
VLGLTTLLRGYRVPTKYLAKTSSCVRIYVLVDPTSSEVRYVGQTRSVGIRHASHRAARSGSFHLEDWKRNLSRYGKRPLMYTLCRVIGSRAGVAERHAIRHCLAQAARLLNWNYNWSVRWSRRRVGYRARPDATREWRGFLRDYRDNFE